MGCASTALDLRPVATPLKPVPRAVAAAAIHTQPLMGGHALLPAAVGAERPPSSYAEVSFRPSF